MLCCGNVIKAVFNWLLSVDARSHRDHDIVSARVQVVKGAYKTPSNLPDVVGKYTYTAARVPEDCVRRRNVERYSYNAAGIRFDQLSVKIEDRCVCRIGRRERSGYWTLRCMLK